MSDTKELREQVAAFNDARGWRAKHTPTQLAMSAAIEAAELLEVFQWLPERTVRERLSTDAALREAAESEIADVAIYLLGLCDLAGLDLGEAVQKKLRINDLRFPIENGQDAPPDAVGGAG